MQLGCSFHQLFHFVSRSATVVRVHAAPAALLNTHSQQNALNLFEDKERGTKKKKNRIACLRIPFKLLWDALRESVLTLWMDFTALIHSDHAQKKTKTFVSLKSSSRKTLASILLRGIFQKNVSDGSVLALVLRSGTSTVIWPHSFFFFFSSFTGRQFNQCTPSVLLLHRAALGPSGETEQRIDFGMLQITLDTWFHWLDNCLPAKKKRTVLIWFWRFLDVWESECVSDCEWACTGFVSLTTSMALLISREHDSVSSSSSFFCDVENTESSFQTAINKDAEWKRKRESEAADWQETLTIK